MELVVVLVAAGGAVVAAVPRLRRHFRHVRSEKDRSQSELSAVAHLAEADAVMFGEELARLDTRVADAHLDDEARVEYQTALDAYEHALRIVDRMQSIEEVSKVVDVLASGRYAAACVQARVEGAPAPTSSVPCFFDPRHGPAATEVLWNQPGRGSRKVPACAQDAARRAGGQEPAVTTVRIDGREVPYWAAGGLFRPYENGYTPRTPREAIVDHKASYSLYDNPVDKFGGFGY